MLDALLHGQHVGTLVREASTGVVSFILDEAYMADATRPVLGQQFEDRREHRVFRQAARPGRLPALAARSGFVIPRNELVEFASIGGLDPRFADLGSHVFVIERYDRVGEDVRIHQEDFAQVRGILPEQKYGGASYEALARIIGDLCGHEDLLEFVKRLAFMIVSGNTDMHLKNWSLIYPDQRNARLAPAYDLVFVRQYLPNDTLALPLAKERNPLRIGWEHFARLEKYLARFGLPCPVVATARDFAARCVDDLRSHRASIEEPYRGLLEAYVDALPLVRSV